MPVALQPARIRPAARTLLRACLIGKTGAVRKTPSSEEMLSAGKRGATGRRGKTSPLPAARFLPRLR
jgi:hypothetical protein